MIGFCDRKFNPTLCYEPRIKLEKLNLRGTDFNHVNKALPGLSLLDVDMRKSSFRNTGLPAANFSYSNLKGADFDNTDPRFANLENSFLTDATFVNAILIGASFKGAILCGATLKGANVTDANFQTAVIDSSTDLQDAFFREPRIIPA